MIYAISTLQMILMSFHSQMETFIHTFSFLCPYTTGHIQNKEQQLRYQKRRITHRCIRKFPLHLDSLVIYQRTHSKSQSFEVYLGSFIFNLSPYSHLGISLILQFQIILQQFDVFDFSVKIYQNLDPLLNLHLLTVRSLFRKSYLDCLVILLLNCLYFQQLSE